MKSIFETCVPREEVLRALSQEASNASVPMAVRAEFEGGLTAEGDQFQTIRDVLDSLGMGKIQVDGQPQVKEAVREWQAV